MKVDMVSKTNFQEKNFNNLIRFHEGLNSEAWLFSFQWWIFRVLSISLFATNGFLTISWWLINTSWATLVKVYDVERPEILRKNISNDVFRYTFACIPWILYLNKKGRCPRGVMVKAMDCGILVREFVLQSRYYVHFRPNTLILPAMG